MRLGKGPRPATGNRILASGKLLLASTKLVQDKLPPGSLEAKSREDSSDQDDNNIRLPSVRAGKGPKTTAANGKLVSNKLSSASTKFFLRIEQDERHKKIPTLKTG